MKKIIQLILLLAAPVAMATTTPINDAQITGTNNHIKSGAVLYADAGSSLIGFPGTGTVTSVAATVPSFLSIAGSPITGSGTLAISYSGTPLPIANGGTGTTTPAIVAGSNITVSGSWPNQTINSTASGSGSVTSVSVTTANGVSGSVATATTTPAITLTLGAITPTSVNGNTITTGTGTLTLGSATLNAGAGGTLGTAAFTAATDYEVPLTFSTGLTRSTNTITVNSSQNIATLSNLTTNGFVKTGSSNGTLSIDTNTYLTSSTGVSSITGTTNQITASGSTGAITLSLPATVTTTTFSGALSGNATTATALAAGRTIAITGDLTYTSPSFDGSGNVTAAGTLANIPTATPMAGSLLATAITAPSTPASGKGLIYVDSTSKNLAVKDDAGVVKHGVQTNTGSSNNFVTAVSDAGVVSTAQPAFTNLSGSVAAGQMPALTGDVTTSAGAVATTLATVASAGTTGSSTAIPVVTINAKGLTTSITTAAVVAPAGTLTGSTLASGVTASSLTSVGTLGDLTVTNPIVGSITGNAATVTTNANLTGPVTSSGNATTIANLPTATVMSGSLLATAITAPSTPASGNGSIYVDSTSKNIAVKDDAGVIKHGVQTNAGATSNFLTAISDAGVVSRAQPAAGDITGLAASATTDTTNASNISSGTLPDGRFPATLPAASGVNLTALNASNLASGTVGAARMPALTGDVTTSAGAVATTLATVATAGTTGSSSLVPVITIDAKGRTTSITTAAISAGPAVVGATSNSSGNSTITPTSSFQIQVVTVTGTASTRVFILSTSGRVSGDQVVLRFAQPSTASIVEEVRNATSGGTLLYSYTTDGTGSDTFVAHLYFDGSAWEPLTNAVNVI